MNIELCTSAKFVKAGILYFSDGVNITVHNTRIKNTCNGSEIYGESITNLLVTHVVVINSGGGICGSICLLYYISGLINITSSTFTASKNDIGVELFAFINFAGVDSVLMNSSVYIDSCNFMCRTVLVANLGFNSSMVVNNVSANGCSVPSYQGGISISGVMGKFYVQNSTFSYFYIAMIVSKVIFSVYNSLFSYNMAVGNMFILRQVASALSVFEVDGGSLYNVTFVYNGIVESDYSISNSPGLLLHESSVTLNDCKFISNKGHGLYSYLSDLSFTGRENLFASNQGYEGAAMYLLVDDTTNIQYTQAMIQFQLNAADYTGGAILIAGMKSDNPKCPFNTKLDSISSKSETGLVFSGNKAKFGGDNIYGGCLDEAVVHYGNITTRCIEVIRQSSVFNNISLSSISSKPSRVCLCDDQNQPDCLNVFSTTEAYPGEDISLSVVAVGQTFGTSAGFVKAQLLQDSAGSKLSDHQKYQVVSSNSCNILVYNTYSKPEIAILVLTTEIKLVQNYGNVMDVQESIEKYNMFNHSFVPKPLLNFPVYVNVTIKECPPGFILSESPQQCTCDKRILDIDGVKCLISSRQLERSSTVWIGKDNGSQVVLFSKYCPYNYCKSERVNIFNSSDLQCRMSHAGRLCGQCPVGTSLALGTSQCKQCSNVNLYLLLPFAVSGVVLVIFLKLTDLTTAGGLINGLILYANLVKAGSYIYFPATSSIHLDFLRVFIDWLNLDLGIETCFFDGLTGYWKTWLQFVFPLYVWVIALTMILMARYNIRMTRLLGNNSVPVLATLFLLSYAKLFRVINTAIKFTILEDQNGTTTTVWSYDGSIDYLSLRHSILLIVALLVLIFLWLPYTSVLLFVQCLQRCSVQKINRFVWRMQPFLDAHCGPFKDNRRYWFGVLLIARAIPLLVGTVSSTNSDRNTILCTIAVIGIRLVFQNRVYRKLYVSISESLFLLNLLILAGSALYTLSIGSENQEVFTTVLVGFVFLQFIVMVILSTAQHFRLVCLYNNWIPLHGSVNNSGNVND